MADLLGLAIGFALGGAVLVHYLPQLEQMRRPSLVALLPAPRPAPLPQVLTPPPPAPRQAMRPRPAPAPQPDIVIEVPAPAPLPEVAEPGDPDPADPTPARGTGAAGTGFFVTSHLIMTAAHVVHDCRRTQIISPLLKLTAAQIEARDAKHDIALLRVAGASAPAVLAIGRPTAAGARVFILGYPATAGALIPAETWGVLENDKLPHDIPKLTDPRQQVWMEAAAVTHGYSGGPIFDPHSGKVVGIVRAGIDGERMSAVRGMPTSGLAIGPGSALLNAFLDDTAPGSDAFPADQWGDDPLTVVRHATVHVFCWH